MYKIDSHEDYFQFKITLLSYQRNKNDGRGKWYHAKIVQMFWCLHWFSLNLFFFFLSLKASLCATSNISMVIMCAAKLHPVNYFTPITNYAGLHAHWQKMEHESCTGFKISIFYFGSPFINTDKRFLLPECKMLKMLRKIGWQIEGFCCQKGKCENDKEEEMWKR